MSQWTINDYGERIHKRQHRRRANLVYYYKRIYWDGEWDIFSTPIVAIYTAKPKVNGAYPEYKAVRF